MATGNTTVDAEHQEWIQRFNEFENSITDGHGSHVVHQLLNFMIEYAESHFTHEEQLAGDADTPHVRRNRLEHNRFRESISRFQEQVRLSGASTAEVIALKTYMQEWLLHHICFVDQQIWADAKP
jgi:hemerythrin